MISHPHLLPRFMKFIASIFALFLVVSTSAYANFHAKYVRDEVSKPKIDGALDEAIWKEARVVDRFYQTQPFDKVEAPVKTEVRMLYDEKYLYVGIKNFDSQADAIRDSFARRDKISPDQDFVGLYIDPSSAHKSAQAFYVNARGIVMDGVYSDTSGDDTAPDYDFDVATAKQIDGWSAEFRIPFASIAYDQASATPWSLLVIRNMTRDQRYRMYSGEVTRATNCNLCFSNPIEGLTKLPSGKNWSITPQLVLRSTHDHTFGNAALDQRSKDLSLDVKFKPDSATRIDATLNPDFSQVELDSPQLSGNTLFSIYVPEKRTFFLEGADIFKTTLNAISTRTIADPDFGLRYTRRDADKDVSILSARDVAGGSVIIPHTYYSGRAISTTPSQATDARLNFRVGALSTGWVYTDRTYLGLQAYNRVLGPDMVWQIDTHQSMRAQYLYSMTTAQADDKGNLVRGQKTSGHAAYLDWSKGNDEWAMSASWRDFSQDFRDDNGFFSQVGMRGLTNDIVKKFGKVGPWNEMNLVLSSEYRLDEQNSVLARGMTTSLRVNGALDSFAYFNVSPINRSRVSQDGQLFSLKRFATGYGFSPSKAVARIGFDLSYGDSIDVLANQLGRGGSISIGGKLRPHERVEIEPSIASNWITSLRPAHQGERAYTETALQMTGIMHLDANNSLRLIVQDASSRRNQALYDVAVTARSQRQVNSLVYAYKPRLGTATYLGWTQTLSESAGNPQRRQSELFAKLSWGL